MSGKVVIVGASVAGVRTAQSLRGQGHTGRIVLLGGENNLPYDKPPLSKQYLSGTWEADKTGLLTAAEAETAGIELKLGVPARGLDPAEQRIRLADGSDLNYDTCVITTGASARPSPWPTRSGVHVLRTFADSKALREDLRHGGPVVVVGGGFIGAEVAATAHQLGSAVTVVDPLSSPMARLLGDEVGALFADLHRRHGVATHFGSGVEAITGEAGDLRVELTDGEVLRAATVVVGIGATPNDVWLASSGLLVDDGVVCDEYCRSVDRHDVYAAGDVARWLHPGRGTHHRVEHWTNAVEQASVVAYNITHPDAPRAYSPLEYVWSDQYDWRIQIVGRPAHGSVHSILGSMRGADARGAALYEDAHGLLAAAVTINWPRAQAECRRLIPDRTPIDIAMARMEQLASRPTRSPESPKAVSREAIPQPSGTAADRDLVRPRPRSGDQPPAGA